MLFRNQLKGGDDNETTKEPIFDIDDLLYRGPFPNRMVTNADGHVE